MFSCKYIYLYFFLLIPKNKRKKGSPYSLGICNLTRVIQFTQFQNPEGSPEHDTAGTGGAAALLYMQYWYLVVLEALLYVVCFGPSCNPKLEIQLLT